ncbi:ComF family protein [Candidatus Microgenomates bacterium]|nr:MAG: ComF family protein [Candidatus Microgenomates bacterium]
MLNLFNLLFPPQCVGCGKFSRYICASCAKKARFRDQKCPECDRAAISGITHPGCRRPYGLDGLVTVYYYDHVIKKAIKLLKYRLVSDCANELIGLLPDQLFPLSIQGFVLFPMPLSQKRKRWRGFNQSEVLGRFLAEKLHVQLVSDLLIRHDQKKPQADILERSKRLQNARGIFALKTRKLPDKIIVFDDVYTTGATMKEAGKVLKRGGVKVVWGLTLAR